MDKTEQKTIYLCSLPRSLTTAFLRAMVTVEGCLGINEPYKLAFYAENKHIPVPPTTPKTFEEIRDRLQKRSAGHKMVFIKAMGKHLAGRLDDHSYIPRNCVYTFLIRHPVKTVKSFLKAAENGLTEAFPDEETREKATASFLTADTLRKEQSYRFLDSVFTTVTQRYGQKPIILDADDLQCNPEGTLRAYCREVGIEYQDSMVHWGPITPEQREIWPKFEDVPAVKHFIGSTMSSTGFTKTTPDVPNIDDIEEKYRELVEENLPLYEKLHQLKLTPDEI